MRGPPARKAVSDVMTALVEIKQLIKGFYIRYEMWITPLWKFLLSFIAIASINGRVGYLAALKPLPIVLMCALLCSFMPVNFMVFVMAAFILGHFYAVSIETLAVTLVLFLLMFLLYFRFGPNDTVVLVMTPLFFVMKIPYLMPLALGLLGSPLSIAAMSCGVIVYYLLNFVQMNATTMGASSVTSGEDQEIIVQLRNFLTGFLTNRAMWIVILAFAAVLIIVWLLRRLPVDHAWKIAILGGAVVNLIALMAGDFLYDIQLSFVSVVFGTLFSALLCFVLEFFFFQLDYTRTERVQFEDDEYYYYVKAVPKVTLAEPERKVKSINRAHHPRKPAPHTASRERDESDDEEVLKERIPSHSASQQATRQAAARSARPRPAAAAGRPAPRPTVSGARSAQIPRPAVAVPTDDTIPDRVLRVPKGNATDTKPSGTGGRTE